jgi:hypothetical protein
MLAIYEYQDARATSTARRPPEIAHVLLALRLITNQGGDQNIAYEPALRFEHDFWPVPEIF